MRQKLRHFADRSFTVTAVLSIVLMAAALVIILGPMLWCGAQAVVFRATVEWREMQLREPLFDRGDKEAVEGEVAEAAAARQPVYEAMDEASERLRLDPTVWIRELREQHRAVKRQLRSDEFRQELSERIRGGGQPAKAILQLARENMRLRAPRLSYVREDVARDMITDAEMAGVPPTLATRAEGMRDALGKASEALTVEAGRNALTPILRYEAAGREVRGAETILDEEDRQVVERLSLVRQELGETPFGRIFELAVEYDARFEAVAQNRAFFDAIRERLPADADIRQLAGPLRPDARRLLDTVRSALDAEDPVVGRRAVQEVLDYPPDEQRRYAGTSIEQVFSGAQLLNMRLKFRARYPALVAELEAGRAPEGELMDLLVADIRDEAYALRDRLDYAFAARYIEEKRRSLSHVLGYDKIAIFQGTPAYEFVKVAQAFEPKLQMAIQFEEISDLIYELFGPRPGTKPRSVLIQDRYGATRWDDAQGILDELKSRTVWVSRGEGQAMEPRRVPRAEAFRGTDLEAPYEQLVAVLNRDLDAMMHPRLTFYWQYFIDDCSAGWQFGGVGPEIVGTLLLTLLTMVLAVPVGIVAAAYLVECTSESPFVRVIRTCINTLAGVPSIVFGLFGLAFFLLWLPDNAPWLGMSSKSNILAGSLTLAVLVLPIVIRASEGAIRAVPQPYKEAALSVGAGKFRTFMTVTLPAALPGVLTSIILSMSRAAGETAPILFTAAVAFRKGVPNSIFQGGTRALPYSSYQIAVGDVVGMQAPHKQYGMIMTLILLVLLLNMTAILIRSRVSKKLRGQ
jgi:phosphate transport system permease protein